MSLLGCFLDVKIHLNVVKNTHTHMPNTRTHRGVHTVYGSAIYKLSFSNIKISF